MNIDKDRLNAIDQDIKDIVFGYNRNINKNIPMVINHIIIFYYYNDYKFNRNNNRSNISILNDNTITKQYGSNYSWSTIFYGNLITNRQCNKIKFKFKWKKCKYDFYFGFIINKSIKECISSYKIHGDHLGNKSIKKYSVGIYISQYNNNYFIHDQNNNGKELKSRSIKPFKQNDIFNLIINFKKKSFVIYHNDNKSKKHPLYECNQIIPAFSLYHLGEQIEVINLDLS